MVKTLRAPADMAELEQYLKTYAQFQPNGHEALVLELGIRKQGSKLLPGIRKGKMKMCFKNALQLALDQDWDYCEGYAHNILPVHHAWVQSPDGTIVDPTWRDAERCVYAGLVFNTPRALGLTVKIGTYGLFYSKLFQQLLKNREELLKFLKGQK